MGPWSIGCWPWWKSCICPHSPVSWRRLFALVKPNLPKPGGQNESFYHWPLLCHVTRKHMLPSISGVLCHLSFKRYMLLSICSREQCSHMKGKALRQDDTQCNSNEVDFLPWIPKPCQWPNGHFKVDSASEESVEFLELTPFTGDSVEDIVGRWDPMASTKIVIVWDIELDSASRYWHNCVILVGLQWPKLIAMPVSLLMLAFPNSGNWGLSYETYPCLTSKRCLWDPKLLLWNCMLSWT